MVIALANNVVRSAASLTGEPAFLNDAGIRDAGLIQLINVESFGNISGTVQGSLDSGQTWSTIYSFDLADGTSELVSIALAPSMRVITGNYTGTLSVLVLP
jgi:hypothetical protein